MKYRTAVLLDLTTVDAADQEVDWAATAAAIHTVHKICERRAEEQLAAVRRLGDVALLMIRQHRATRPSRPLPTRAAQAPRRSSSRRATTARARAARVSARPGDEPEPPLDRPRGCRGCGSSLAGLHFNARWCDDCQDERNRAKVTAFRDRQRPPATTRSVVAPTLKQRRDAADVRRIRDEIDAAATSRLHAWRELPESNGNREELRADVARLTNELEKAWDELRTVRA